MIETLLYNRFYLTVFLSCYFQSVSHLFTRCILYLLLLDASKAFDRVKYVKLFNTLHDRKMCPIVLRLIMNMYTNQEIQVKWNTVLSSKCKTSNGVKQGGCLSPSLFSVYLNNLIVKLRNSSIGCRYRSEYMGVFGYADDLSLLCPSFSGIREMLKGADQTGTFMGLKCVVYYANYRSGH